MRVGIVDYYERKDGKNSLLKALSKLGHSYTIINGTEPNVLQQIQQSPVKKWICTGANRHVLKPESPQVPTGITKLKKDFLLICYSMESFMHQMGYPIYCRKENKNEKCNLKHGEITINAHRNHFCYIPTCKLDSRVQLISSHRGETMTVIYKNLILVQWHPEGSAEGCTFLDNWLQ